MSAVAVMVNVPTKNEGESSKAIEKDALKENGSEVASDRPRKGRDDGGGK